MIEDKPAKDAIRHKQCAACLYALANTFGVEILLDSLAHVLKTRFPCDMTDDSAELLRAVSACYREDALSEMERPGNAKRPDLSTEPPLSSLN